MYSGSRPPWGGWFATTLPCLASERLSLFRSLVHQPEEMLCVLVIVFGLDSVAGQCSGTRERYISLVARLWVDALIGPPPVGARCGSVRAGGETLGAISSISRHGSRGGFSMAGRSPCIADIRSRAGIGRQFVGTSGLVGKVMRSNASRSDDGG